MSTNLPADLGLPNRLVRLDTILRLRWLAILGQLAAIFIVVQGLGFDLQTIPCFAVIGVAAAINITLQLVYPTVHRLTPPAAAALLGSHIAELATLLFLTGGLQNPFSFLFVAPVLISATALPPRLTLTLAAFAIACMSVLGFFHLPLPWNDDDPLVLPQIYMFAVWLSIVLVIVVTSIYAFQVTEESRKLSDALAATELVLSHEQHLTQLDGLAAAAAHELGTPLSTITLIVRELERGIDPATPIGEEIRTLREQTQRCRDILSKLTQLSSADAQFDRMELSSLIEEVIAPHRDFGIIIKARVSQIGENEPVAVRNPAILYGIGNILENAVDFARSTVEVDTWWNDQSVDILIADDGPGIPPDVLKRIGEPYLSRRTEGRAGGLGLGVFIARTLLERSGATVSFRNRVFPDHGAVVHLSWPRDRFESASPSLAAGS